MKSLYVTVSNDIREKVLVDGMMRPRKNSNGKPIHPTDAGVEAFGRWFGDSLCVDTQGRPLVMYHGTSKDDDFKSWKISKRGAFFTADPDTASSYAKDNESRDTVYEGSKWVEVNTASRVIPVYLKVLKPYTLTDADFAKLNVENYAKAQAALGQQVLGSGHDAIDFRGDWVIFNKLQVKSALGNSGKFDPKKADITASSFR